MPRVNIYIRQEDLSKWEAIENKSEFVSSALNADRSNFEKAKLASPENKVIEDSIAPAPLPIRTPVMCKNGHISPQGNGRCMTKGCKYNQYSK